MNGYSALMWACDKERIDNALLLIQAGCDMDIASIASGWTALMVAIRHHDSEIALALIKAGCNVDIKSKSGKTALILAQEQAVRHGEGKGDDATEGIQEITRALEQRCR